MIIKPEPKQIIENTSTSRDRFTGKSNRQFVTLNNIEIQALLNRKLVAINTSDCAIFIEYKN